jgi:hypothetical protein
VVSKAKLSMRLDPASVDGPSAARTAVLSAAFVTAVVGVLLMAVQSPEFGRPGWWTMCVAAIGGPVLVLIAARNVHFALQAYGRMPVVTLMSAAAPRAGWTLGFGVRRGVALGPGDHGAFRVDRVTMMLRRKPVSGVYLVFVVNGEPTWRVGVAPVREAFDWEGWARRELATRTEIAVVGGTAGTTDLPAVP